MVAAKEEVAAVDINSRLNNGYFLQPKSGIQIFDFTTDLTPSSSHADSAPAAQVTSKDSTKKKLVRSENFILVPTEVVLVPVAGAEGAGEFQKSISYKGVQGVFSSSFRNKSKSDLVARKLRRDNAIKKSEARIRAKQK